MTKLRRSIAVLACITAIALLSIAAASAATLPLNTSQPGPNQGTVAGCGYVANASIKLQQYFSGIPRFIRGVKAMANGCFSATFLTNPGTFPVTASDNLGHDGAGQLVVT